jgi:hypothetical protein
MEFQFTLLVIRTTTLLTDMGQIGGSRIRNSIRKVGGNYLGQEGSFR